MKSIAEKLDDRSIPEPNSGCVLWLGPYDKDGYGKIGLGPQGTQKHWRAHRLAYVLHRGEIPSGLVVDHLCRNTSCINPEHLEAVTVRENTVRGNGPGRASERGRAKTHCKHGHTLSDAVIRINRDGYALRNCLTCKRRRGNLWRVKKKGM